MGFAAVLVSSGLALAQWNTVASGVKSSLRGIHTISGNVAWASGAGGTVLRDEGGTWQQCATIPGTEKLDFRGIWAWGSQRAIVMSSGPGDASRLYGTSDGCRSWKLLLTNSDPEGFWDAVVFTDEQNGVLLGDPVKGRFVVMRTADGGEQWVSDTHPGLEATDQGAFAASNSALAATADGKRVLFGTGGKAGAHIFVFNPEAGKWTSVAVPVGTNTETAGVFSLAFRDSHHGLAVGGDFKQPDRGGESAAFTSDGGQSWTAARTPPSGYRSAVEWDSNAKVWIAVGPNGSDLSRDDGRTWRPLDKRGWNAVSLPWAVGPDGRLGMLELQSSRFFEIAPFSHGSEKLQRPDALGH